MSIRTRFRWRPLVFRHYHPSIIENKRAGSFSMAAACFSPPPPHHHRKRVRKLVFDGGRLFSTLTTPPPSKPTTPACFRWRPLVFRPHHPSTIENERARSFSMAAACFPPSPPLHHRNRACALVFDGGRLFSATTLHRKQARMFVFD